MESRKTPERKPFPRILFVSSVVGGGSGRSQRELDAALRARGVETLMLVDDQEGHFVGRFLHEQLWDASVRFKTAPVLSSSTRWLRSIPGRRARHESLDTSDVMVTMAPENAFPDIAVEFRPDIVVASSITRPAWRAICDACADLELPTVLYLREEAALSHFEQSSSCIDLVLANSRTLVDGAADRGVEAELVPSVVDVEAARCTSSRDAVLLVNPISSHGINRVADLAANFPTTSFVLQESWPLSSEDREIIDSLLGEFPNVSFRDRCDSPADVFRDAFLLLAPHEIDNRPRTVLEAQANGIPVVASAQPGLVEAVGPGGICVPVGAAPVEWRDAVGSLLSDPKAYTDLRTAATAHAGRPEVDNEQIVDRFLDLVSSVEPIVSV